MSLETHDVRQRASAARVAPSNLLTDHHSLFHDREVAMPGLVKNLVVVATVEGLILHPPGQRNQRTLHIKYNTHQLSSLPHSKVADSLSSAELYGIVGTQLPMRKRESFTELLRL